MIRNNKNHLFYIQTISNDYDQTMLKKYMPCNMNRTFDKMKRPSIKRSPLATSIKYGSANIFLNRTIYPESRMKCATKSDNFCSRHSDAMLNIEKTQKMLPILNTHCQIEGFSALSSNKSIYKNVNLSSNSIISSLKRNNKIGLKGAYASDHKYVPLRHLLRNKEKSKKAKINLDRDKKMHCILKLETKNEIGTVDSFEKRLFNEYHMKCAINDGGHINVEGSLIKLQKFIKHSKSRQESYTLTPIARNRNGL